LHAFEETPLALKTVQKFHSEKDVAADVVTAVIANFATYLLSVLSKIRNRPDLGGLVIFTD